MAGKLRASFLPCLQRSNAPLQLPNLAGRLVELVGQRLDLLVECGPVDNLLLAPAIHTRVPHIVQLAFVFKRLRGDLAGLRECQKADQEDDVPHTAPEFGSWVLASRRSPGLPPILSKKLESSARKPLRPRLHG